MGSSRSRSASEDPEHRESPAQPMQSAWPEPQAPHAPAAPSHVPVPVPAPEMKQEEKEDEVSVPVTSPKEEPEDYAQKDLTTDSLINSSEIPEGVPRTNSGANNSLDNLPEVLLPPRTPPRKKSSIDDDHGIPATLLPQPQKPALPGSEGTPDLAI